MPLRNGRRDVCLAEVVSLEKQRFARRFRQAVRKTIPEIETRRVATFSVVRKSLTGKQRLLGGQRFDGYIQSSKHRFGQKYALRASS